LIVSYKHNFIFVKTRKTAGTSIEIALSTHAGEKDIVTPIANDDELIRFELYPASMPRNYLTQPALEEEYVKAVRTADLKGMSRLRKMRTRELFLLHNHSSARRAIKVLGKDVWDAAFTFAVERHPYEKAVSRAWFRKGDRDFPSALDIAVESEKYRNYDLYTVGGKVVVDAIFRFEHLYEELKQVEDRLGGLDVVSRLPQAKSHFREDRRPAAQVLSAAQKSKIQQVCAEEFALMGYAE
jgi:hypothetical protein